MYNTVFFVYNGKAEHEIREAYLTPNQELRRDGGGVGRERLHQDSNLISYPEKWDWREKGFVTDVSACRSIE